ncbi:RNA polymerase sigma factor [Planctomyces sp. SH-PL62]|uniref:RNA polymerase sigma factor n=1 Tax=Planctomyces sp. SH-PL62 TaxID=1636152 RepID=UPI00078D2095|nr:sigma-70 family RNA polymerase sigma factor [Planctomyces sp. SH-PL62]AMV40054.1 ECF RNA polymerase sigma factor SigE [Planctomyces sp. SH-PL62]
MAGGGRPTIEGEIRKLWAFGTLGGADDRALLSRFALDRDEPAEEAFRILVERHGPMVLRVCRQILDDRQDAEDAAQVVFLVLARKASSIRVGGSLAPWLHGAARRIASKSRGRAVSRRRIEERAAAAAEGRIVAREDRPPADDWEAVHEEVARLPEKYRAPVVHCYLQGLTYEEAARRIGCPIGTVRVRLSRARERLRARLARRGFGPAQAALIGRLASAEAPPLARVGWSAATIKAVDALRRGRPAMLEVVPSSVVSSYEGMVRAMVFDGCKTAGWILAAAMMTTAGAVGFSANGRGGQEAPVSRPPSGEVGKPPAAHQHGDPAPPEKPRDRTARERMVDAARERLEAQLAYYKEGRITIDRLIDASGLMMEAESTASPDKRLASVEAHAARMGELEEFVESEDKLGRSAMGDLTKARLARRLASLWLKDVRSRPDAGEVEVLRRRVEALEERLDALLRQRDEAQPGDPG